MTGIMCLRLRRDACVRGCVVMGIEASQLLIYCIVSYRKVGKLE